MNKYILNIKEKFFLNIYSVCFNLFTFSKAPSISLFLYYTKEWCSIQYCNKLERLSRSVTSPLVYYIRQG